MIQRIRFTKMQAVGNDFILIDAREYPNLDWPGLAIRLCHRLTGIGADGLLVVDASDSADVRMRMYNPDGTEDVCGNGMRCVARYVADDGRRTTDDGSHFTRNTQHASDSVSRQPSAVSLRTAQQPHDPTTLTIETLAGVRTAQVAADSGGSNWTVDMGAPRFVPTEIPMLVDSPRVIDYPLEILGKEIIITALSTGTTHSILLVDKLPGDEEFLRVSPALENHVLFPERTSVMWTRVLDSATLQLRIWERGVGETWGCGTGACAAAVAAILHGFAASPVEVHSKGGALNVEWHEGESILLNGPAEYVFEGCLNQDLQD